MKKLLLTITVCLFSLSILSQSCLPEGISFTTQEQINNFPIEYPDCTEIVGNVDISGADITNLYGLSNLTTIKGHLGINSSALPNLEGLERIITIGGNLQILVNLELESLLGLENLTTINGRLVIWRNHSLSNLSGLENLTSIDGDLHIEFNLGLNSLSGLENINPGTIDNLAIANNSALSYCEVQSVCEYLSSPNGIVNIYRNANGCDSPPQIANGCGIALSCLPYGNYHFRKQDVIDNFQSDYSNCSKLTGYAIIAGDGITNLDGLTVIKSIENELVIWDNDNLLSLEGLDNISSVGGALYITVNFILSNLSGLETLTSIGGNLEISANFELINLTGLDNLATIGGSLEIRHSRELIDFTGLSNLKSIGNRLKIYANDALVDISAIESLTSIGGELFIWQNNNLESLEGLQNINAGSISDLTISDNPNLSTCEIQNICEYLSSPNGFVEILNNDSGCNSVIEIANNCNISLPCLPYGNYYFFSQSDIDDFQLIFPGCTDVGGNVTISGEDITSLNGINVLTSVGGDLHIRYNNILSSITGLQGVTSVGQGLVVSDNAILSNLNGLENINSIGGWLSIDNNPELRSLTGINNLVNGVSSIGIRNNDILTSLNGVDNIDGTSINILDIYENDSLSTCEVQSVCDYLAIHLDANIYDNAPGCNSYVEVEEACATVAIDEVLMIEEIISSPNPFTTSTSIEYELKQPEKVTLKIYNHLGKQVYQEQERQSQGKQQLIWKAEGYADGVYYYRLQVGDEVANGKMVKVSR